MRHPFHQPAGVDKHQGDRVGPGQSSDGVQGFAPDFVGGDGAKFLLRQLDGQVDLPPAAGVNYDAVRVAIGVDVPVAHQEAGHFGNRPLGCGQPDAGDRFLGKLAQPLHRQRQMRAAFVIGHRVYLVQDQRPDVFEPPPPAVRGQQYVQRFGGGDQDVRRPLGQFLPFR